MTTTPAQLEVPTIELTKIRLHPSNPRRNAVADQSMVDSIATVGLYDPLMVAPDPETDGTWILIDGHRRYDGCQKAGLLEVPVNPRFDLVTEAQQIEAMVITGLQKEKLTPVEEAAAYEQLALAGMDVGDIAASTGFPKRRIQDRMKLNSLTDDARDHLYLGEATLEDAEALLEFEDDPDLMGRLNNVFGTHNFRYEIQTARSTRERRKRHQALVDGFEEQGAKKAKTGDWRSLRSYYVDGDESLAVAEGHKGCLAWVGEIESYSEPFLVCSKPSKHKTKKSAAADDVDVESNWEKQREERARAQAAAQAATAARLAFLSEHIAALLPTKGNSKLAALAKPLVPLLVTDSREAVEETTLFAAFALDSTPVSWDARLAVRAEHAATYATASAAGALEGLATYIAALIADQLDIEAGYLDHPDQVQHHLVLWDWLAAAGYVMSDADKTARSKFEDRLAELDTDQDGDDS